MKKINLITKEVVDISSMVFIKKRNTTDKYPIKIDATVCGKNGKVTNKSFVIESEEYLKTYKVV